MCRALVFEKSKRIADLETEIIVSNGGTVTEVISCTKVLTAYLKTDIDSFDTIVADIRGVEDQEHFFSMLNNLVEQGKKVIYLTSAPQKTIEKRCNGTFSRIEYLRKPFLVTEFKDLVFNK